MACHVMSDIRVFSGFWPRGIEMRGNRILGGEVVRYDPLGSKGCYYVKHNQHANAGGPGGMPPHENFEK